MNDNIDSYDDFVKRIEQHGIYSKKYYERNKERMRKYQKKYLQEIKLGIRVVKKRKKDECIKLIRKKVIITFD